jgi:hypothetical protein
MNAPCIICNACGAEIPITKDIFNVNKLYRKIYIEVLPKGL